MPTPTTPNKGFNIPTRNSEVGTWDTSVNGNSTILDNLLGSTQAVSLSSGDATLTQTQANNLIFNLTGTLTGNRNLIFPAIGAFCFINNQTTGNFTVTVKTSAVGSIGSVIPQGALQLACVDGTNATLLDANIFTSILTASTKVLSPLIDVSGANGTNRILAYQTAGSDRWRLYANNVSESGSNAGSNIALDAIADDGSSLLFNAFTVNRSTGIINFPQQPQVNGITIGLTGSVGIFPACTSAPPGYIVAKGQLVSRSGANANLWAWAQANAAVVSDGSWASTPGNYSSGDGSTTFRLPQIDGLFLRMLEQGSGYDPGRAIGTYQADQFQDHTHNYDKAASAGIGNATGPAYTTFNTAPTTIPVTGNHGSETRGKNAVGLGCIHL